MEQRIAHECEQRGVSASEVIEDALKMYFGMGGHPMLGMPIPDIKFMVFYGKPEVFESRDTATARARELALEDRDYEPYTVAVTCETLLSETYVVQNMGVRTKKLSEVAKERSE